MDKTDAIKKAMEAEREVGRIYPVDFIGSMALAAEDVLYKELAKLNAPDTLRELVSDAIMLSKCEAEKRATGNINDVDALWLGQEMPAVIARVGALDPSQLQFGM